ncbi:MAG TPA: RNA polymerase sigma-54 factor [Verrucomicrobiales bacterium]|nr:RNA polymerase factor sigma-54 [Roseibacillus sp.]HAT20279.1 RNA polymerase sigma-54 factor [Verrucomicrobiales bacterium]
MPGPSLNQTVSQTQTLAPQMRQSLEILQSNTLELQQLLRQFLETNPVLEHELPTLSLDELDGKEADTDEQVELPDDDLRELAIMERRANGSSREDEERREHLYNSIVAPETLQQHLVDQLNLSAPADELRAAALALIGNMDQRGYFDESLAEVGRRLGIPVDDLERAKTILQSFDPSGIAVDDLQESLLVQLHRSNRLDSLEFRIVQSHLNELARKHYPKIARAFSVSVEEVVEAATQIAQLDPAPGTSFDPSSNPYIIPDVSLEKDDEGEWTAVLTNEYLPRLRLSDTYKDLVATSPDRKLRTYLRNQLREGRTLIKALDQRQATILAISEEIIRHQTEFLEHGPRSLKPLTMNEVADALEVHPATVSRAVAGKHARTPHGVMDLRRFFATGYKTSEGHAVSNQGVRESIQSIVHAEDRQKPLSDAAIQRILSQQGIKVARRTVAKYREQLNILPSHLRRSF